jgi:hypothetical protein
MKTTKISFMLVLENLDTHIVTTSFTGVDQLQDWLRIINKENHAEFVKDPFSLLPTGCTHQRLISIEELDELTGGGRNTHLLIEDMETWRSVHGTLLVDDNASVFYSVRKDDTFSEWKLPYQLCKGIK